MLCLPFCLTETGGSILQTCSLVLVRLGITQGKLEDLDRKFQGGSDVGKQRFGGKVDPSLVVGLAEERMKKLLDTYDADKTVSLNLWPHCAFKFARCWTHPLSRELGGQNCEERSRTMSCAAGTGRLCNSLGRGQGPGSLSAGCLWRALYLAVVAAQILSCGAGSSGTCASRGR